MKQNAKSAIFTCENGKRLLRQLLLLLPAWIVLALGIAMCVFSGVGSDTNTSFQQGLGRMLGLQTGTVTLIFNCTVLAIFIFANRSLVGLGSLVIGFGLGPLLNLYLDLLGKIFPTMPPMWARIALCTLANQIGICRNAEPLRRFTVDNVAVQHKRSHAIAPLVQNVIL